MHFVESFVEFCFFLVSSQTDTGPDGEIIVGNVTQFIFPSIKHSILSDLEGKRLKIYPYERWAQNKL